MAMLRDVCGFNYLLAYQEAIPTCPVFFHSASAEESCSMQAHHALGESSKWLGAKSQIRQLLAVLTVCDTLVCHNCKYIQYLRWPDSSVNSTLLDRLLCCIEDLGHFEGGD